MEDYNKTKTLQNNIYLFFTKINRIKNKSVINNTNKTKTVRHISTKQNSHKIKQAN